MCDDETSCELNRYGARHTELKYSGVLQNQFTHQTPNAHSSVTSWPDSAICPSCFFGTGLCSGGNKQDCRNNGQSVKTKVRCSSFASTVATLSGSNKHYRCGTYGSQIECNEGYVVTEACTSGGKPN